MRDGSCRCAPPGPRKATGKVIVAAHPFGVTHSALGIRRFVRKGCAPFPDLLWLRCGFRSRIE
jgi:hypothetical protein